MVVAVKVWASRGKLIVETCAKVNAFTRVLHSVEAKRARNHSGRDVSLDDTNLVLLSTTLGLNHFASADFA